MIAPVPLPAPAPVQVDNDLTIVKLQLGDLHFIAGIHGGTMRGNRAVEQSAVLRLAHVDVQAFFSRGQRLDRFRELTGHVTNQRKFRVFLEGRVFRAARGFRLGLRLTLPAVRRRSGVWEEGKLLVRRKTDGGVRGRTKAVDPRNIRVSQKQERERYGEPIRHRQGWPPLGPCSLFYDAGRPVNRCQPVEKALFFYLT